MTEGKSLFTPSTNRHHEDFIDKNVLEKYGVVRKIGRGAYGCIFEINRRNAAYSRKNYALKKVFNAFQNSLDAQRTFREITYLLEFSGHSNLITCYDVMKSNADHHLYYVVDLMDADLQRVMKNASLQPIHRTFITYQLLRALKYVHSGEVVHRDLKPANILVNSACEVRLGDFGLARSMAAGGSAGEGENAPLTDYISTRWYRAPEMLLNSTKYTKAVDMWALGCVCAEMAGEGMPLLRGTSTLHMLEIVIEICGKPSKQDIQAMRSPYAVQMLDCLPNIKPTFTLTGKYPSSSLECVDLMQLMLQFNPARRITAEEALTHPYCNPFHNPDDEPSLQHTVVLPLPDTKRFTVSEYRDQIYADVIQLNRAKRRLAEQAKATEEKEEIFREKEERRRLKEQKRKEKAEEATGFRSPV